MFARTLACGSAGAHRVLVRSADGHVMDAAGSGCLPAAFCGGFPLGAPARFAGCHVMVADGSGCLPVAFHARCLPAASCDFRPFGATAACCGTRHHPAVYLPAIASRVASCVASERLAKSQAHCCASKRLLRTRLNQTSACPPCVWTDRFFALYVCPDTSLVNIVTARSRRKTTHRKKVRICSDKTRFSFVFLVKT